ncbi:MAG: hypothetical protein QM680_00075 [Luteolibacter sp.]
MKQLLLLGLLLTSFLHAETEDEFIARVKAAWESKDADKIISLYHNPEKLDAKFVASKRSVLEHRFKFYQLKEATILDFLKDEIGKRPQIDAGKIFQLPAGASKSVYLKFSAIDDKAAVSYFASMIPILQDQEKKYWLAAPEEKSFEWNGPKLDQYTIQMAYEGNSTPCPEMIVLIKSCGYVNWTKISGNSGGCWAHEIIQIIVPPTTEAKSISFEISKNGNEPFFTKTVNTSKGAIVPIDTPAP